MGEIVRAAPDIMHIVMSQQRPGYEAYWRNEILASLSLLGLHENPTEATFQNDLTKCPEILADFLGEGQPVYVRQETPGERERLDILLYFYGAAQFDIVECKARSLPIIGTNGEVERALWDAIVQVEGYRSGFMAGHLKVPGVIMGTIRPRIMVIGWSAASLSVDEESAVVEKALLDSKWATEYQNETLIVTTWRSLAEKRGGGSAVPRPTEINFCARRLLSDSVRVVTANAQFSNLRNQLESNVSDHLQLFATRRFLSSGPEFEAVQKRANILMKSLEELNLLRAPVMKDLKLAWAALQIADILLYEEDGDIPWGRWDHGATYPILDLLREDGNIATRIAPKVMRILSLDKSADALGRASHLARSFPKEQVAEWWRDRAFSSTWSFPSPNALLREPRLIPFIQVGYLLAKHGVTDAIDFMNACGDNGDIVARTADWNVIHAAREPKKLEGSLREKAESPDESLGQFSRWHRNLYEAQMLVDHEFQNYL